MYVYTSIIYIYIYQVYAITYLISGKIDSVAEKKKKKVQQANTRIPVV